MFKTIWASYQNTNREKENSEKIYVKENVHFNKIVIRKSTFPHSQIEQIKHNKPTNSIPFSAFYILIKDLKCRQPQREHTVN